jgi:hypothetical protein
MATQVQNTQEVLVVVNTDPSPKILVTQDCLVVVVAGRYFNVAPTSFNLEKLILTVKESNIPARGRNQ